jgi:DNA repair photolyase
MIAPIHGRGTISNPLNRFETLDYERDYDADPDEEPAPITQFITDTTRSIISHNESPDVGFSVSVNPYRGCEHGCVYCYARPTHEFLGMSAGLDFETKILVKHNAPELLRSELSAAAWKPQPLALSGVTDCYQPVERKMLITRRCLEVLCEFRNPTIIITKNRLVTRDIDLLQELRKYNAIAVAISVTSLDRALQRELEPRASTPENRLQAIRELSTAGIPVGVMVGPVIPGLTDHEIPSILKAAAEAGATGAGYVVLRLPFAVKALFEEWLEQHRPLAKGKVLNAIRSVRGGGLNDPRFNSRMRGEGPIAEGIKRLFEISKSRYRLDGVRPALSVEAFRVPGPQMTLWE